MTGVPRALREAAPRAVAACLLATLVVAACGGERRTASGIVITVTGSSPAQVTSFSLRTADGELLEFEVGPLQTGGQAFPAAHLREHQASASPVEVVYELRDGRLVAVRLSDATH